jgi:hypothetical protein
VQAGSVRTGKQFAFAVAAATPDRPDGMQHPARGQVVRIGHDGRAGWCAVRIAFAQFPQKPRSGGSVDGAVDTPAAAQLLVGGVGNGVDGLTRDIAARDLQPPFVDDDRLAHRATRVARSTWRRPARCP